MWRDLLIEMAQEIPADAALLRSYFALVQSSSRRNSVNPFFIVRYAAGIDKKSAASLGFKTYEPHFASHI